MKTKTFFVVMAPIIIVSLLSGCSTLTRQEAPSSRTIDPIVSTDWLHANSHLENLLIIDIRSPAEYGSDHIPGSVNEPFVMVTETVNSSPAFTWFGWSMEIDTFCPESGIARQNMNVTIQVKTCFIV